MRNFNKKIMMILLIILSVILIGANAYAHSGRTDSRGGHKDNKNKSGLGSYHYHCGGYPAHLHTNGVCPYSSSAGSAKESVSTSSEKTTSTVPTTISVTDIKIKERLTNMEVGESQQLTVTINPYNATDQNVVWKSSDESIAIVSSTGVVNAIKSGLVDITVTSANGKSDVIKISINEVQKNENNAIINTTSVYKNNQINNSISNSTEESNPLGGLIILGLLSGGGYLSYKNSKKR